MQLAGIDLDVSGCWLEEEHLPEFSFAVLYLRHGLAS
jgi:hypothetical protein